MAGLHTSWTWASDWRHSIQFAVRPERKLHVRVRRLRVAVDARQCPSATLNAGINRRSKFSCITLRLLQNNFRRLDKLENRFEMKMMNELTSPSRSSNKHCLHKQDQMDNQPTGWVRFVHDHHTKHIQSYVYLLNHIAFVWIVLWSFVINHKS